jgi:hypothetical protein
VPSFDYIVLGAITVAIIFVVLLYLALRRNIAHKSPRTTYKITVDYDLPVEAMVKAGKYNDTNSDITSKNFPPQGSGRAKLEAILVQVGDVKTEEALDELEKRRLRAGTLAELLAFGAQHPNAQQETHTIALGSVCLSPSSHKITPYLWRRGSRRGLGLGWLESGWLINYRFLAFSK